MKIKFFILYIFIPCLLNADVSSSSGKILDMDIDARSISMAGATTAGISNPNAIYWNVAGLTYINSIEVSVMHLEWIQDSNLEYISIGIPFYKGTFGIGIGLNYTSFKEIDNYEVIGHSQNNYDLVTSIGYSQFFFRNISFGATIKYLRSTLLEFNDSTFAFDIGCMYKFSMPFFTKNEKIIMENASIGITVQNIGEGLKYNEVKDPLPLKYSIGFQYQPLKYANIILNQKKSMDSNFIWNIGMEFLPDWIITPRTGYKFSNEITSLTIGMGIKYLFKGMLLKIDYAANPFSEIKINHWISLGIKL